MDTALPTALHRSALAGATVAVLSLQPAFSPTPSVSESTEPQVAAKAAEAARDAQLAALLGSAATGDAKAFETFYDLTIGYATGVVRRIVGDNHCDDVLSDAYFQAWREARRFDPQRGSALTWLLTLARSRALDRLRAESLRHGGLSGAPEADEEALGADDVPGPEALLASTQASHRLHAALAGLSPNERWVLGLAYFRDMSQSEIAAVTALPLGTVKSLVHRAQQKLRAVLQPTAASPAHSSASSASPAADAIGRPPP